VGANTKAVFGTLEFRYHFAEMEFRPKGLDLLGELVDKPLRGNAWAAWNVVDGLLRVEFGALPPGPVEDVDQVAFQIEQPKLENCEQPARAGADDHHIRFGIVGAHKESVVSRLRLFMPGAAAR